MDWENVVSMVATEEGLLCTVRGADGMLAAEPVLVPYTLGKLCPPGFGWDGTKCVQLHGYELSPNLQHQWYFEVYQNGHLVRTSPITLITEPVPPVSTFPPIPPQLLDVVEAAACQFFRGTKLHENAQTALVARRGPNGQPWVSASVSSMCTHNPVHLRQPTTVMEMSRPVLPHLP